MGKNIDSPKIQTIDPVCGMTVDPASARGSVELGGKTYHFCSAHCVSKFEQDPQNIRTRRPRCPVWSLWERLHLPRPHRLPKR